MALLAVSLIVFCVFIFGGSAMEGDYRVYNNTGLLLYWTYAMVCLTAVVALIFALTGFFKSFANNRKGALAGLAFLGLLVVIFVISFAIGSSTPLPGLNEDSQQYNTSGWLKSVDMFLYTIYALGGLTILAVLWNALKSAVSKK